MTGTARLGKGVRREAESEESRWRNFRCDVQVAAALNSRGGYEAFDGGVTRPGTGMPNSHSGAMEGRSDGSGRRRRRLPREISVAVRQYGLP